MMFAVHMICLSKRAAAALRFRERRDGASYGREAGSGAESRRVSLRRYFECAFSPRARERCHVFRYKSARDTRFHLRYARAMMSSPMSFELSRAMLALIFFAKDDDIRHAAPPAAMSAMTRCRHAQCRAICYVMRALMSLALFAKSRASRPRAAKERLMRRMLLRAQQRDRASRQILFADADGDMPFPSRLFHARHATSSAAARRGAVVPSVSASLRRARSICCFVERCSLIFSLRARA